MTRGRAGAGPAREKSEPRDTRPLTHREGTRATADQAGGLIRRVCCRPPHCFPAAVPLRAVSGGRGGVQEGPPLVQEGSRKGPGKGLHAPARIARTRGCGGWRRRLGVMTERETSHPHLGGRTIGGGLRGALARGAGRRCWRREVSSPPAGGASAWPGAGGVLEGTSIDGCFL